MKFCNLISNKEITEIYTGNEDGCHGNYFKSGSVGFVRALNRAKKFNYDCSVYWLGAEMSEYKAYYGNGWVDFCLPGKKTITIYFKH